MTELFGLPVYVTPAAPANPTLINLRERALAGIATDLVDILNPPVPFPSASTVHLLYGDEVACNAFAERLNGIKGQRCEVWNMPEAGEGLKRDVSEKHNGTLWLCCIAPPNIPPDDTFVEDVADEL